jgi:hypothetical protein
VTVTNDPYHYDDPDWSEPMTGDQRFCKCGHSRREHSVLLPRGVGCYRYNCICIDFEPKDKEETDTDGLRALRGLQGP